MEEKQYGVLVQAVGPVVDVRFKKEHLPSLLLALKVKNNDKDLYLEVVQHIGDDTVRCVAMGETDGIRRGLPVENTFSPIKVPVGKEVLGRMFNVLGEPIDGKEEVKAERRSIYQNPPTFKEQSTKVEIFET